MTTEKRIKVFQLQPDYNVKRHDFADLAEQIVQALPADKFEVVSVFLRGRPIARQPVSKAERSVYFNFSDKTLKGARLSALWQLYQFCRREHFDVAICNRFKPVNMMLWLNRLLRIPLCIGISHSLGEYDRNYRRWQARTLINNRWRFVGVSPAVRQYLLDCQCGFTPDNTVSITNAIDIEQARSLLMPRKDARWKLGLPPDALIIGTIGRLVRVKGYHYLIQAFARIAEHHPNAILAFIGDGRAKHAMQEEIEKLKLQKRVLLLGARPDALRYVRAFDIWAMPSLAEGFPLALLEAMTGELPIIASDIPSMHDLVSSAGGQLVPPADAKTLATALDAYLKLGTEARNTLGHAAYTYLKAHHDIAEYRHTYRTLIENALEENTRPNG